MTTDWQTQPPASTLETLRRFWLDVAASVPADTEDIAFVMEVMGRIFEAIQAEYKAKEHIDALTQALQRPDELLYISSLYGEIAAHLLEAAGLWGEEISNGIAGCPEEVANGMETTKRSLLHICKSQRVRLTEQALRAARKQVEFHRQVLELEGCQELLIL